MNALLPPNLMILKPIIVLCHKWVGVAKNHSKQIWGKFSFSGANGEKEQIWACAYTRKETRFNTIRARLCSFSCIFPNIADFPQNFSPWWKNKMAGNSNLLFNIQGPSSPPIHQTWECSGYGLISGHFYKFSLYKGIGKFLFQTNCSKCIIMPGYRL